MEKMYIYEIKVEGHLADGWADWFDGLSIQNDPGGVTTLRGLMFDQAALLGLLNKFQALNITLISVVKSELRVD